MSSILTNDGRFTTHCSSSFQLLTNGYLDCRCSCTSAYVRCKVSDSDNTTYTAIKKRPELLMKHPIKFHSDGRILPGQINRRSHSKTMKIESIKITAHATATTVIPVNVIEACEMRAPLTIYVLTILVLSLHY